MEMDDELENFIRERKARVAEDKARLEQDPPYMEMKAKPHRSYESTVKENIPPNSFAQGKEESCSMGLPLGVEYERKKQRLQHELRMDYRRYMAQQHLLEDQTGFLPKQRVSSRRNAATLTEENKGLQRALRLVKGKALCPEEEDEQPPLARRYRNRPRRPVDQESEEDEYSEELELMEDRRMGTDPGYERRRNNKTDGREKRENPAGLARDGRRFKALTKSDDTEFATGLIIGADDTDETLRRRKERYRQELQEQIAEQHRNKKREKDLELKVAATGANDPEKQPDRIRQFGLSRRRNLQVLQPSATGDGESSPRGLSNRERIALRERELPPPEQPHVAFQSPLLDYSSALGLGGGLSPNGQPTAPSFHRDTPRIPMFPPHPPSGLSDAYRNLYTEPHFCYGSRNLLDPNMAYCGHLSVPGAGLPVSCWNVPQGGTVPSRFGNHSPHSQYSGSSFPDPPTRSRNEAPAINSPVRVFPAERSSSTRERILSYRDALKEQIQEQQERRRLEKEERERYEARLEADMKNHQPWGRGGGGAPLKDSTGNLIADLNQMHKLNEEAYINPEQWQRKTTAAMTARQPEQPDPNERVSGFTHVQTPQFARGKVFSNQPTQQQLQDQDKYKAFLKQQIEEKMRKKAEERELARLEEEKEEKRLAEQRARIQREFEEEQERKKQKEKEQKMKNEELIQQAEERKKEAERKKKDVEEKENGVLRRQYERERQARVEEVCREPSPPIPTLQKKHVPHQFTPRPPTVDSQHSTVPLSERSLSGLQSPPVPARRTQLRAACDQRDVFSELSALRRQLRSEQKRLENHLQQDDWEELDSPLSDRLGERPPVDVFDMARLRLQAPVRRPNSRNMEPRNLLQIHDSLQLKYTDAKSRLDSTEVPKLEEVGVTSMKRHNYRETYHQLSSHRSTAQDDYFDLSPTHQNDYLRSVMGRSARGSLLESESAFIDPLGNAFPVPRTPECEKTPQLSARERRRLAKQSQHPQEGAASRQCRGQHDSNTGPVDQSDDDDDDSPPRFSLHNMNHRSSRESAVTDSWTRPGTSDTQKCLDRPSRRERSAT